MFGVIPTTHAESEEDARQRPLTGLVGSVAPFAAAVDHSRLLDSVGNQRNSNSCVAFALSTAIYLAGQAQQQPVKRPSIRWAYDVARYVRTPGVLIDMGCSMRDACMGAERHGIVAEERWPFNAARVDEPPPLDVDMAGADASLTGWYRAGSDPNELRRALEKGHMPTLALRVHQNFVDWSGDGVYDEFEGEFRGYHQVCCVAYRPGAIRVVNSWSSSWSSGGFAWLSDRFVASSDVFDRYVLTAGVASR